MLSNGISASSGLQCSQDSISLSALRRVAAGTRTITCSSNVGSKKSTLTSAVCPTWHCSETLQCNGILPHRHRAIHVDGTGTTASGLLPAGSAIRGPADTNGVGLEIRYL